MQIMLRHVEQEYTQCLAYGNRSKAMGALRVPVDPFTPFDFQLFRLGAWFMFFFFSVVVLLVAVLFSDLNFPEAAAHFTMFRGLLYPTLMTGLIAIDVYIWKKHHINYLLIFGLDHRSYTNHIEVPCSRHPVPLRNSPLTRLCLDDGAGWFPRHPVERYRLSLRLSRRCTLRALPLPAGHPPSSYARLPPASGQHPTPQGYSLGLEDHMADDCRPILLCNL